ncbi:MAG: hypothetical protein ACRD10_02040, partial [Terriglobia bacterium]
HIFPYSSRPSTPAGARKDQLESCVARQRSAEMRRLIGQKRRQFLHTQVGRVLSTVTLGKSRRGEPEALSSSYLRCSLPGCDLPANRIVNVRMCGVGENGLWGGVEELPHP